MKLSVVNLSGENREQLKTEIMFSVASERASGNEVIRFNVDTDDEKLRGRIFTASTRILKNMKESGSIQFFATPKSFVMSEREASFLMNKYPEIFENFSPLENELFIFVRI